VRFVHQYAPKSVPKDPDTVEVYFGLKGKYERVEIRSDATQEEIEMHGCDFYNGNVVLIECPPPMTDVSYKFKTMFCHDRENAASVKCDRTDTVDEEWILLGQELSDVEITRILEDRWMTSVLISKPIRPLVNDMTIHFAQRAPDQEEPDEMSVAPLQSPFNCSVIFHIGNPRGPRPRNISRTLALILMKKYRRDLTGVPRTGTEY
jgi:hypothetical protein